MEISAKLKAAMAPKNAFFTAKDQKYFNDPRWDRAKELAYLCKWPECQRLVAQIDKDFGKIY